MNADEVARIGARQTVDRVLADLVAASQQGVDEATVRQLATVRLELFDDVDLVELLLLAAGMFAALGSDADL